jgi:hypothetical protein
MVININLIAVVKMTICTDIVIFVPFTLRNFIMFAVWLKVDVKFFAGIKKRIYFYIISRNDLGLYN